MSKQRWRDEFLIEMGKRGVSSWDARKLLRCGATLQRLAEAECNGDYPCDNGERRVTPCPQCEAGYVPSHIKRGQCDNCRAEARAFAVLRPYGLKPYFQGDPRGAVFQIVPADAPMPDVECGRIRGLAVPA